MHNNNRKPSSQNKFTLFVSLFIAYVIFTSISYAASAPRTNAIYISPLNSARAATLATIFLPGAATGWINKTAPKAIPVNVNETNLEKNNSLPQI